MNTLESYKQTYLETLEDAEECIREGLNNEYVPTDMSDILADNFMARGYLEAKGINLLELEKGA